MCQGLNSTSSHLSCEAGEGGAQAKLGRVRGRQKLRKISAGRPRPLRAFAGANATSPAARARMGCAFTPLPFAGEGGAQCAAWEGEGMSEESRSSAGRPWPTCPSLCDVLSRCAGEDGRCATLRLSCCAGEDDGALLCGSRAARVTMNKGRQSCAPGRNNPSQ